jgi:glycosyltransferase 2 family protein
MLKRSVVNGLRRLLSWGLALAAIAFLANTLLLHWQEVQQLRVQPDAFQWLAIALGLNLFAHLGLGITWGWILESLHYKVSWYWALITFAMVEVAKYLPGDIWQLYVRIRIAQISGISVPVGVVSIILESTYLSVAATALGVLLTSQPIFQVGSALAFLMMLVVVHPRVLNGLITRLNRIWLWVNPLRSQNATPLTAEPPISTVRRYPTNILIGLTGLIGLRAVSFVCSGAALSPIEGASNVPIVAAFSVAWVIGIVMPGIPGGVGLFEAIMVAFLQGVVPMKLILGSVILYRLLNTVTEAIAAGLGWWLKGQRSFAELARLP